MRQTVGQLLDKADKNINQKQYIANQIIELKRDFEIIKKIKDDVTQGSIANTMMNLQTYTVLKDKFFKEVNRVQLESLHVMTKMQYVIFQRVVLQFHKEL